WFNVDLPIKSDTSVGDELKSHHLILVGRPAANKITSQLAEALPVSFGPASFAVRGQTYANMESGVLCAGVNPVNPRFTIAVIAGNSAAATLAHAGALGGRNGLAEVKIFDPAGKAKQLLAPAPELVKNFGSSRLASREP